MSASGVGLSVAGLQVRYGAPLAVDDVTFEVPAGKTMTILGANGAGKSSIARACSGLVPASAGTVRLGDTDITAWPAEKIRQAGLAYLPESRGIFPTLSVMENLRLAARLVEGSAGALLEAFKLFPVLEDRRTQTAGSMSGGEQQMLALARALISKPRLMIVDEPSLGLAPLIVDRVFEALELAKKSGVTIVLVEQFAFRALALSDSCLILQRGRVAWSGPADAAPEMLERLYIGGQPEPTAELTTVATTAPADPPR
jgi:branched-chain amino acid transport system ATP-binding protein